MRLTDADRIINILQELREHSLTGKIDIDNAIYLLERSPTAYDIDKVVDELEFKATCIGDPTDKGKCEYCENYVVTYFEAINIIKRGGVDDVN